MAVDQIHEQNNKIIKGVGGCSSILNREDDSALIRWEICQPEIARLVSEFENTIHGGEFNKGTVESSKHHEDNRAFKKTFSSDVKSVLSKIVSNRFEQNHLTTIIDIDVCFEDAQ